MLAASNPCPKCGMLQIILWISCENPRIQRENQREREREIEWQKNNLIRQAK